MAEGAHQVAHLVVGDREVAEEVGAAGLLADQLLIAFEDGPVELESGFAFSHRQQGIRFGSAERQRAGVPPRSRPRAISPASEAT